ncbi:MAG: hypothetical protein MNPFHGCM_00253 [Gemmatimonadaceae bacterium]|nr:hypothetical protein [Gemmatimonadaceae bacterium]
MLNFGAVHRRRRLGILPVVLLALVAACEPATGPGARNQLDARAALEDYQAMEQVFSTTGWTSFQALSGRTSLSVGAAAAAMRELPQFASAESGRPFVARFFRDLATSRTADPVLARTVISNRHLGKTFVYDASSDEWVIDPQRPGAPANGVRFVLYEVGSDGRPIPSKEVGYADLLDEGANTGSAVVLRLIVVERGITLVDYRARVDFQVGKGQIDVDGYVQNREGTRLTFTVNATGKDVSGETRIDADFLLKLSPRNFEATGAVRGVAEGNGSGGQVDLTVKHGSNSLRVDVADNAGMLDGVVYLNSATFATVTGPAGNPTLRGPTGEPLSPDQLRLLHALMHMVDDVFDLIENLVEPVEKLLLLGWIL